MSTSQTPPAGWTLSQFKAVCADVGSWTFGTVQGAFNEKASLSQIIVDAAIGMIPLVGDATAVRDLLAVLIGMADSEEKRHSTWQWVLLVVLLFALIPIFGGVVKGVGRIIVKVAEETAHLVPAARAAHMQEAAREVIEFLNRIGMKNAEQWLLKLRIGDHALALQERLAHLIVTLNVLLLKCGKKVQGFAPDLYKRIESLRKGLSAVADRADQMIPKAVKELDQKLRDIQAYIRSGGESTSRVALYEVATGTKVVSRAQERRLVESGVLPVRTSRGGFKQNPGVGLSNISKIYKHDKGFPYMLSKPDPVTNHHTNIEAFSGEMINRQLKENEEIFRFFGPPRTTHEVAIDEAWASGGWWGLGKPPKTAKEWREYSAVLDSFNGDGYFISARVGGINGPKAVVGTVSEQSGAKIPGQYLPGGATQAYFRLDDDFSKLVSDAGHDFITNGGLKTLIDPITGLEITFHKTDWRNANGVWGYIRMPGVTSIQTAKIGGREKVSKQNNEVSINP